MFGRATIRLGIGPHSSMFYCVFVIVLCTNLFLLLSDPPGSLFTTFGVRHSRGEMYSGHGRLSVCPSSHSHTNLDVTWEWYGVPSSCALLGAFAIVARVSLL